MRRLVLRNCGRTPQMRCEVLMRELLVLLAPPGSRLPARVPLASPPQYPLVLPSAPNAIRALLDRVLASHPGGAALPQAPLGPPAIRNQMVLATPVARPATRLVREIAQRLRTLDFRQG